MVTQSLTRLRKRVARAKLHSDTVRDEIAAFLADNRYELTRRFVRGSDAYPGTDIAGYWSYTIASRPIPPSDDWAQVIGDCVHDLHSTLDHIVCALARSQNANVTCSNAEFPVCKKPEDWCTTSTRNKIRGVPPNAKAWIKGHQPYQWGYSRTDKKPPTYRDNWLWMLNELSNWDKHRAIHVVAWNNAGVSTSGVLGLPLAMDSNADVNAEVARVLVADYDPDAEFRVNIHPEIQFDRGGPCAGLSVDYWLDEFHRRVSDLVDQCAPWLS